MELERLKQGLEQIEERQRRAIPPIEALLASTMDTWPEDTEDELLAQKIRKGEQALKEEIRERSIRQVYSFISIIYYYILYYIILYYIILYCIVLYYYCIMLCYIVSMMRWKGKAIVLHLFYACLR